MRTIDADIDPDSIDWRKGDGLVPAVVQDSRTLQVLMLGYMSRESLALTLETGNVTFFSRSRQSLWQKGESSGNVLTCVSIHADCDQDALLVKAIPAGPTCHLDRRSCFGDGIAPGIGWLAELECIIQDRKSVSAHESYTARLFEAGPRRIAQKVGEEGVETALAGATGDTEELRLEAADLIFHLMVLLEANKVPLEEITQVLRARHQAV